jgi:hypothetical protein
VKISIYKPKESNRVGHFGDMGFEVGLTRVDCCLVLDR